MSSFYLTCPSDASLNFFPQNTLSEFTVKLPNALEFDSDVEVALTELIFPHSFHNITEQTNSFEFDVGNGVLKKGKIPCGFYDSTLDLIKAISHNFQDKISVTFNKTTKKVKVNLRKGSRLILHTGIAENLGFEPGEIKGPIVEGPFAADPKLDFHLLYVYCDIVEPQIVGNVYAPLLRIVKVHGQDGEIVNATFERGHYIPLARRSFDTLHIYIRTHTGRKVSFKRGKVIVKLHFRLKHL